MLTIYKQYLNALPDKRVTMALTRIFDRVFPNDQDKALTAHAGGGQSSALALNPNFNFHEVATVATANDSIALPAALAGAMHFVKNSSANSMQVYGSGTDTIDSVATATGIAQGAGEGELYVCMVNGNYVRLRGAGNSDTFVNLVLTGLLTESFADALTAHSGGTQALALALTKEINRITTVAAPADSVALPASAAGLTILVINSGANPMQVFGAGTDTINDVATATGVSQMVGSVVMYVCSVAGKWYTEGIGTGYSGSLPTFSYNDAKTAATTQTQAGGLTGTAAITTAIARFTTVANTSDCSTLPVSAPGLALTVINAGAKSMQVFPNAGGTTTETINSLAANAAIQLPPGGVMEFYCTVAGQWHTLYTNPTASLPFSQRTSISSGNGTLTGAQVAGAQLVTLLTSGATAQTTPTAAAMLAAISGGQVGMQWRLRIVNTNGGTLTITADASVTNTGTLTLATNTWREWDMQITSATTATMMQVGTGTTS